MNPVIQTYFVTDIYRLLGQPDRMNLVATLITLTSTMLIPGLSGLLSANGNGIASAVFGVHLMNVFQQLFFTALPQEFEPLRKIKWKSVSNNICC
jgi:hypothetical protein